MPVDPSYIRTMTTFTAVFNDADTPGTYKVVFNGGAGDSLFIVAQAFNNDTIDHTLLVDSFHNNGSSLQANITIPAGTGVGTVPPLDVIAFLYPTIQHWEEVGNQNAGMMAVGEAINTGKLVTVTVRGGSL